MTTENKYIWHAPEAVPDYTQAIVFLYKSGALYAYEPSEQSDNSPLRPLNDLTEKWAYVDDLITASKALDVAIDTLKDAAKDTGNEKTLPGMDLYKHVKYKAKQALAEIDKIMKGGK